MKHILLVFLILIITFQMNSARQFYFINRYNYGQPRQMTIDEMIEFLKEEDKQRKLRVKEEKERRIYKHYLANRIKSSIVRDFLTMRYLAKNI